MSAPEISVILPVYNRADLVVTALESALSQDGVTIEVLLVDDGSTDALDRALSSLRDDSRLIVLRHSSRRGAAAARNTAIAAARGTWLAFLDSDDEWLPGKLAKQMAALRTAGSEFKMALTGSLLVRESGHPEIRMPRTQPSCRDAILRGCTQSPGSAAIIAKEAFDKYGPFDEQLKRLDDWDWLLRFTRSDDFIVVPEALTVTAVRDFSDVETVDRAASIIWRRHASVVRTEGLRRLRTFASAVLVERGFSRFAARRHLSSMLLLAVGLILDSRGGEFPARIRRRFKNWLKPPSRETTDGGSRKRPIGLHQAASRRDSHSPPAKTVETEVD